MNKQIVILTFALFTLPLCSFAATHIAGSPLELASICHTIQPGDTVVLSDGTYTDQHFIFNGKGTKENPITLRAETAGKVVLNGMSKLSIGGDYLVVVGLLFRGGALKSGSIIEFRAKNLPPTRHCVLH